MRSAKWQAMPLQLTMLFPQEKFEQGEHCVGTTDTYSMTLSTLIAARAALLTPEWQEALDNQTAQVRLLASESLLDIQRAIASLSNAVLAHIAEQMNAQEEALQSATANLEEALEKLDNVQGILVNFASFVNVIAKIVPLI